ncbi:hypothetical protein V6N13_061995 [Hibiscus sabdariffa]|uniref:Uncharacterized protein n=2 Tax=Hibiscus sabdariffa TaxID=183260 RepID=A0ABR2PFT9_9ROSI
MTSLHSSPGVDLLSKIHNLENRFAHAFLESRILELPVAEFDEQFQLCLAVLKHLCTLSSFSDSIGTNGYDSLEILRSSDSISQTQQSPHCLENGDPVKKLSVKLIEIEKLKSDNLVKDNELVALRHRQKGLEAHIRSVEEQKSLLEENIEIMQREVIVTAKFLDDLLSEMMEIDNNKDSRIPAEKILTTKPSKLEDGKQEIDAVSFKDEIIKRLKDEMEVQRLVMRQKIEEMQRQCLVVQEEYEYLKIENLKLIEECSMLQKENNDT